MSQKRAEKLLRRQRRKRKKAQWHDRNRFERMVGLAGYVIEGGHVGVRLREMPPFHNRRSLMVDAPLVQAYHAGRLREVLRVLAANRLGLHLRRRMGNRDKEAR